MLSGCPSPFITADGRLTLPFGYADVDRVDVYTYSYAESPTDVRRTVLTDRREIAVWVGYLTDLPISTASVAPSALAGGDADGYRFHLRDGSTFEITHIFLGPTRPGEVPTHRAVDGPNYLIRPDGTVQKTDFGSPSGYDGSSTVTSGWPRAVIGK